MLEKGDLACIWMVAVGIEKNKNVSEIESKSTGINCYWGRGWEACGIPPTFLVWVNFGAMAEVWHTGQGKALEEKIMTCIWPLHLRHLVDTHVEMSHRHVEGWV